MTAADVVLLTDAIVAVQVLYCRYLKEKTEHIYTF